MKNTKGGKSVSGVAALVVFGLFAICVLGVLLTGAGAYSRLTERDAEAYDSRTCVQYLSTKVRQAAAPEGVEVGCFGDGDALYFYEDIGGEKYLTRVYCYDGWLMELFTAADGDFVPADGEKICRLQAMDISMERDLLCFSLVDGSESAVQFIRGVRGWEGGAVS